MSKIFMVLAGVAVLWLIVAVGFGLWIGKYNERYTELRRLDDQRRTMTAEQLRNGQPRSDDQAAQIYRELEVPRRRASLHILVGVGASLVTVLVNSISVTYFIGTSRWCKEVVDTYGLNAALAAESARLKRRSFPWALTGILLVLSIVALGAAADPGTLRRTTQRWVLPHFAAALGGGALIAVSFFAQGELIRRNSQVVERILADVRQVRRERGLEVEG